ncbi:MAG: four helix bundle protein [Pseudomonadota bacterium]|jgi:hypothetical protein
MTIQDTPLIHSTYQLYRMLHEKSTRIPKNARYTIWQRCENACLDALQKLIAVSYLPATARREKVLEISSSIDMLRIFIRLTHDTNAIEKKSYLALQEQIDEIGRMLGGWLKALK